MATDDKIGTTTRRTETGPGSMNRHAAAPVRSSLVRQAANMHGANTRSSRTKKQSAFGAG